MSTDTTKSSTVDILEQIEAGQEFQYLNWGKVWTLNMSYDQNAANM